MMILKGSTATYYIVEYIHDAANRIKTYALLYNK